MVGCNFFNKWQAKKSTCSKDNLKKQSGTRKNNADQK